MEFRTEIKIPPYDFQIDYSRVGFSVGSCFAENIASRLSRVKMPMVSNPFGVLFNPESLADMFDMFSGIVPFCGEDLREDRGLWYSFRHHGQLSAESRDEVISNIEGAINMGREALERADYVIVTFGTAWVYELIESGRVVANCHKQPAKMFNRRRLTVEEIVARWSELLQGQLAGKRVIFTLSPVRHIKDGLAENSLSKSILRVAISELVDRFEQAYYFPAYEIITDDLRDYRFYAEDMVHPSAVAVDYVWQHFQEALITSQCRAQMVRVDKVVTAMSHRMLFPASEEAKRFRESMAKQCAVLQREVPEVDLSAEMEYFTRSPQ